jgi:Arc/MetJ family transcription regulator
MSEAMKATGLRTKKEAVELGLRTLLQLRRQEDVRGFRGKLAWSGGLDAMRSDQ